MLRERFYSLMVKTLMQQQQTGKNHFCVYRIPNECHLSLMAVDERASSPHTAH